MSPFVARRPPECDRPVRFRVRSKRLSCPEAAAARNLSEGIAYYFLEEFPMSRMRSVRVAITSTALALGAIPTILADRGAQQAAPAADQKYVWDLGDLYRTPEAWTAEHAKMKAAAEKLDQYKGTLDKGAQAMLTAL